MMSTASDAVASTPLPFATGTRSGAAYWFASFRSMMRFDLGRARQWAALMVIVQVMMGAGMALMYGFFYPVVTPAVALYISTGTPTLALIPLGFVLIPGTVGQQKLEGTFDFIWSMPVPRSAQAVSTFVLYTLLSLPGMALALTVATWRYGIHLSISPQIVPAVLLSALMAVSVGFGMALAIRNPSVTNLIANALIFVVLLFSPIVYPPSNLPPWLSAVDRALPFYNMAEVIRAGLTTGLVTDLARAYLILLGWTAAGWIMTAWVVGRRH
jgi:ABC-2 type transport system permease protein